MRRTDGRRRIAALLLSSSLLLGFTSGAGAADWRLTPRFSANETFTDNVNLDPSGQENSDLITSLNGGLSLRGQGRRLNVNLDYNLQGLRYRKNNGADTINHQLQASGDAELVKQMVFMEARATVRQEQVSRNGRQDNTNLALTGNTTDVQTLSVTPIFRHHFGGYADAEARYSFNYVDSGTGTGTGDTQSVSSRLTSGRKFSRLPWSVSADTTRISNDSGTTSRFANLDGTVRYKFNREWGLVTSAGYDKNSFANSTGEDGGLTWSAGATWTPTPRTSVEARYQSRFTDPGYFLNASHRARRMVFTASYNETLTTSSQQLLSRELVPLEDAFGEPVLDPITGDLIEIPVFEETLTEEVQIQKRLSASASYRGRRNSATLSGFHTTSAFQVSTQENETFGLSASASRTLSREATVSLNGSWQRSSSSTAAGDSDLWSLGTSLNYRLGPDVSTVLNIRRLTSDRPGIASGYDEHRATLRVNVDF